MKNLFNKIKNVSLGLSIGLGLFYLLPGIIPSVYTGTKTNGDEIISITKRKGLFSMVSVTSEDKGKIMIYNFNVFSNSPILINLTDYNKDNLVDEIYFSDDPLTENSLTIERPKKGESLNSEIFQEADKIYQEQIKRFKDE